MSTHLLSIISPAKTKHKSKANMAAQEAKPLPYRDVNNQTVAYAPPTPGSTAPVASPYDSDFEPLIPTASPSDSSLDPEALQHFTATGRPMPAFKHQAMQNWAGDMLTLPQLLPKRYTDESIIPAIIVDVIPREGGEVKKEKMSWVRKLKGEVSEGDKKGLTKVVYMPRGEYLKWFARDTEGHYIGKEDYRRWTEEELENEFGRYKPAVVKKGVNTSSLIRPPWNGSVKE
jgi:hypothetical protein